MAKTRIKEVCSFCSKRKIKCDRQQPCSSCIKSGNNTCEYPSKPARKHEYPGNSRPQPPSQELQMMEIIKSLASKVDDLEHKLTPESNISPVNKNGEELKSWSKSSNHFQPTNYQFSNTDITKSTSTIYQEGINGGEESDEDTSDFNMIDTYDPIVNNEPYSRRFIGPFTWLSLLRIDNGLCSVWNNIQKDILSKEFEKLPGTRETNETNEIFRTKNSEDTTKLVAINITTALNSSEVDNDQLIHLINTVLPTKKMVWELLDYYFNCFYTFLPILDEEDFRINISRIICEESYTEEKCQATITNKIDILYVGILLAVLKICHSSYTCHLRLYNENTEVDFDPKMKHFKENPLHLNIFEVAKICLHKFDIFSYTSLLIFQLGLAIMFYESHAPEAHEGLDQERINTFSSMMIQLAVSLGLHVEPGLLDPKISNSKEANLRRKVWYLLLVFDSILTSTSGVESGIQRIKYNVRLPFATENNANIRNSVLEMATLAVLQCCKNLPHLSLIKDKFHEKSLDLKKLHEEFFGKINTILINKMEQLKTTKSNTFYIYQSFGLNFRFQNAVVLLSLKMHVFNYLEKKGKYKKALKYLLKAMDAIYDDLLPIIIQTCGSSSLEKDKMDILISPSFQSTITRIITYHLAILLRCKVLGLDYSIVDRGCQYFLSYLSSLSSSFFYSWKFTKILTYIRCRLDDLNLFEIIPTNEFCLDQESLQSINFKIDTVLSRLEPNFSLETLDNRIENQDYNENDDLWLLIMSTKSLRPQDFNQEQTKINSVDGILKKLMEDENYFMTM